MLGCKDLNSLPLLTQCWGYRLTQLCPIFPCVPVMCARSSFLQREYSYALSQTLDTHSSLEYFWLHLRVSHQRDNCTEGQLHPKDQSWPCAFLKLNPINSSDPSWQSLCLLSASTANHSTCLQEAAYCPVLKSSELLRTLPL